MGAYTSAGEGPAHDSVPPSLSDVWGPERFKNRVVWTEDSSAVLSISCKSRWKGFSLPLASPSLPRGTTRTTCSIRKAETLPGSTVARPGELERGREKLRDRGQSAFIMRKGRGYMVYKGTWPGR